MKYLCDFHLHSCLSPCGSLDMSPRAMASAARAAGLNGVALTDHNTALNTPAFADACREEGLNALYGLEMTTAEEIHCLALFDTPEGALGFSDWLYGRLPDIANVPEKLGDQPVVDVEGNVLELVPRYLCGATNIPFSQVPGIVAGHGGLFLPAHIDRPANGVLSQLGTLPPESGDILEVTRHHLPEMRERFGGTHSLVSFSDAHEPYGIAAVATAIDAEVFTLAALREAMLAGRVEILPRRT